MDQRDADSLHGPWNPGIVSQIPRALLPLATVYRAENVFTPLGEAEELHGLTGLPLFELVAFRPERLALHELLVRVTADLSVNDGPRVEDLGINFRRMTATLLERHIASRSAEVRRVYDETRARLHAAIVLELAALHGPRPRSAAASTRPIDWLRRISAKSARAPDAAAVLAEQNAIAHWEERAQRAPEELARAAAHALVRLGRALLSRHGRLWATPELIAEIATRLALNDLGSRAIGALIDPWVRQAARAEGYVELPAQPQPIVMNTKGASASGKSTMRPLQHALADHMGVDWGDFALISPDIWRKQLLDYSSLGPHYKYAGAFTGEELHIVDVKLDAYMAAKAERGAMSHLLIDRFRFDSFAPASDEAGSNLLTRFGRSVHLFFMITPPAAIVERSWQRGLAVGRYKAVDDLLAHNIKAYVGMPEVFFTWARHPGKQVRYEFLDNSVPYGERPRAAAFGKDGVLNILDVGGMLDIERHRRIDVRASGPESLHTDGAAIAPERNTGFLSACARSLTEVNFADRASGRVYLRMRGGMAFARDPDILNAMLCDADTRAGILALVPRLVDTPSSVPAAPPLALEQLVGADGDQILGRWRSADQ